MDGIYTKPPELPGATLIQEIIVKENSFEMPHIERDERDGVYLLGSGWGGSRNKPREGSSFFGCEEL
jgi:hypothetical protein